MKLRIDYVIELVTSRVWPGSVMPWRGKSSRVGYANPNVAVARARHLIAAHKAKTGKTIEFQVLRRTRDGDRFSLSSVFERGYLNGGSPMSDDDKQLKMTLPEPKRPVTFPIMRYFAYEHLPPHLAEVSAPFHALATALAARPFNDVAERVVALRKLLEAKDAAVRSIL